MMARTVGRERLAFGEVAVAMALAGSTVVAGRILDGYLPPFTAALVTFLCALAVALPLQLLRLSELFSIQGRELALMALQALFGMVLFRVFLLNGLTLTPAANAGIILSAAPAVTLVAGRLFFHEALGRRRLLAIVVTLVGVAVVNLSGFSPARGAAARSALDQLLGALLILGSVVSESLMTIFRKMSRQQISSLTNTTLLCLMSALLTLPFAAIEAAQGERLVFALPALLSAAYYGSFATVVAYLLWGDGALRIQAGRVGIAMGAMPVCSCLLSALVLHEPVGPLQAAGCLLAVGGVLLGAAERGGRERGRRRANVGRSSPRAV